MAEQRSAYYGRTTPMDPYPLVPEPYPMGPELYYPKLDEYPIAMDPQGYSWPESRMNFDDFGPYSFVNPREHIQPQNRMGYGRSRNEEYLAQARALIQAQNEQMHGGFRAPFDARRQPAPFAPDDTWDVRPASWNPRW